MTEKRIFEILLENSENENYSYDFPKLQPEAVEIVADKFTDIIYETLKQKSTASHLKRRNILKYLNYTAREKECHLNENSFECFLRPLRKSLHEDQNHDVSQLISDIGTELDTVVPKTVSDQMVEFYKRKNAKRKETFTKLEMINKINQERLHLKFNLQVKSNISYYETSESTIRELVGNSELVTINLSSSLALHSADYREKQVKFGYAMVNLRSSDLGLIETILRRMSTYKKLEPFEVNFIVYLWFVEDATLDFSPIIAEKFPFVLERLILKRATQIVQLHDNIEVHEYFSNLESDMKFGKIKKACSENTVLNKTMKNLIFELYYHSICNENVLKLIDFIQ